MDKNSLMALLIDANGFEKKVQIPYYERGGVQPTIKVPDHRLVRKAMLKDFAKAGVLSFRPDCKPMDYTLEFMYSHQWRVCKEDSGVVSYPIYNEVI